MHQTDSKQVILSLLSQRSVSNSGFDAPYYLLTTPHQWFTHVHLLDAHLDRFTPAFQLSFTTNQFPFQPHKVVCKLRLHAVCGGPTTISFKVPKQSHQEAISTRFLLVTHLLNKYAQTAEFRKTISLSFLIYRRNGIFFRKSPPFDDSYDGLVFAAVHTPVSARITASVTENRSICHRSDNRKTRNGHDEIHDREMESARKG